MKSVNAYDSVSLTHSCCFTARAFGYLGYYRGGKLSRYKKNHNRKNESQNKIHYSSCNDNGNSSAYRFIPEAVFVVGFLVLTHCAEAAERKKSESEKRIFSLFFEDNGSHSYGKLRNVNAALPRYDKMTKFVNYHNYAKNQYRTYERKKSIH